MMDAGSCSSTQPARCTRLECVAELILPQSSLMSTLICISPLTPPRAPKQAWRWRCVISNQHCTLLCCLACTPTHHTPYLTLNSLTAQQFSIRYALSLPQTQTGPATSRGGRLAHRSDKADRPLGNLAGKKRAAIKSQDTTERTAPSSFRHARPLLARKQHRQHCFTPARFQLPAAAGAPGACLRQKAAGCRHSWISRAQL